MAVFRVLAANIAEGSPGLDVIAGEIKRLAPDIALLNEIMDGSGVGGPNQASEIAEGAGMRYSHFGWSTAKGLWGKGVAVLSRHPIIAIDLHPIADTNQSVLEAMLLVHGSRLRVYSLRFQPRFVDADLVALQAGHSATVNLVGNLAPTERVIVGGDFNSTTFSPERELFAKAVSLTNVELERPDPGSGEPLDQAVDAIYYRGPYRINQVQRRRFWDEMGRPAASDHVWLIADFWPRTTVGPRLACAPLSSGSIAVARNHDRGFCEPSTGSDEDWSPLGAIQGGGRFSTGGDLCALSWREMPGAPWDALVLNVHDDRRVRWASLREGSWSSWQDAPQILGPVPAIPGLPLPIADGFCVPGSPIGATMRFHPQAGWAGDVFLTDANGQVRSATFSEQEGIGWAISPEWSPVLEPIALGGAPVATVSRSDNQLDLFVRDRDGQVRTAARGPADAQWGGWWPIPGARIAPDAKITAISRSVDKLDLFAVDTAGKIISAAWEPGGGGWRGWWTLLPALTAPAFASVAAVSRSADKLDIFVVDDAGRIMTGAWEPGRDWGGPWRIGDLVVAPGAPITATSVGPDQLEVFVGDREGRVHATHWPSPNGWSDWTQVPEPIQTPL